jgi:predicted transposase YbfD/YdcC
MHYNTSVPDGAWQETGFVADVDSLAAYFERLPDQRCARGKRYRLAQICILAVLAKLSGEDHPLGIAQWAQLRQASLGPVLGLTQRFPCHNTYRRVLSAGVRVRDLDQHVSAFLQQQPGAGQSVLIAIDGKTLRGTIPPGQSQGLHLLAAYLPAEGIVLMQVAVSHKENETVAAPQLLGQLDLRGKIIMGDAMHTQRTLSAQIVARGGDFVWLVKDNQPTLREEIEQGFQPESHVKGFSPLRTDFQTVRTVSKAHGRYEERRLTTSGLFNTYLAWPGVAQVFKLERRTVRLATGEVRQQVVYGITSLAPNVAAPERLLSLVRQYWGIENGLHYRRDKSLREDATRMRNPNLAQNMAALNNLIIGLSARAHRQQSLPEVRRYYASNLAAALRLIFKQPS